MKNFKRITVLLYFLAGILFFVSAIIGGNYVFIPIGCCFICLGVVYVYGSKKKEKSNDEKDENNVNGER